MDGVQLAVDCLAMQKGLDDQDALLKTGSPLPQIDSHGPELARAAAEAGLDDERAQTTRRPASRSARPSAPDATTGRETGSRPGGRSTPRERTEHRDVLHVPRGTGGVVITQGQGIEASVGGGLRLTEHRVGPRRWPLGPSVENVVPMDMPTRITQGLPHKGSVPLDRPARPPSCERRQAG